MPRSEFEQVMMDGGGRLSVEGPAEDMADLKVLWVVEQNGQVAAGLAQPSGGRFRDAEPLPPKPWSAGLDANAYGVLVGPDPGAGLTFWFQRLEVKAN